MSWQDGLDVPMPKIYVPDEDFIGKKVVLHMCESHEGGLDLTGNCNCELKGKTVTIKGLKETPRARFYRSTCYTIKESKNLIHESEFSLESQMERPGITTGYIFEGKPNHFLTAGFNYVEKNKVEEGYLHNTGVTKSLLKSKWNRGCTPTRAYPAEFNWSTNTTRITGEPLSWKELGEKILVSKAEVES
ncbi:MAG TPA: hypothetical protein VFQ60_00310 [Patescibacteria group bacterium]|nr:hypothetical protein [Patescibacteria group bacterium]